MRSVVAAAVAGVVFPASASAAFEHVVAPGESLSSIAATDGLSVAALAAANGLSTSAELTAGSTIAIPPQGIGAAQVIAGGDAAGETASTGSGATSAPAAGGYVVQPGDTLTAIAARYGETVDELAAANGLNPAGLLFAGISITVAGGGSSAGGTGAAAGAPQPPATPAQAEAGVGAQPTPETVSASDVGAIAAQNGVPASLAEAIAYQESGFNNGLVSPTGAVGVMQLEPGTWRYVRAALASPPPLSPASAVDNIRAGSLLLHSLLAQTGGNQELAAAGYYQGLQSVQANGMYADTQQYVNDVMSLAQQFGGG